MTVMSGIDPHKGTHTAVAIDSNEQTIGEITVRSSKTQTMKLREWAAGSDNPTWAVEAACGFGYLLAQQLVAQARRWLTCRQRWLRVPDCWVRGDRRRTTATMPAPSRSPRCVPIGWPGVSVDDHAAVLRLLVKRHRDTAQLRAKQTARVSALLTELHLGGPRTKETPQRTAELLVGTSLRLMR